jgi:hypothetical protein
MASARKIILGSSETSLAKLTRLINPFSGMFHVKHPSSSRLALLGLIRPTVAALNCRNTFYYIHAVGDSLFSVRQEALRDRYHPISTGVRARPRFFVADSSE